MIDQLLKKLEGAYADNTIRAYRSDFEVFANWCEEKDLCALPAVPDTVVCFISFDMTQSSSATIRRRMASISRIHKLARETRAEESSTTRPTRTQCVRRLEALRRAHGPLGPRRGKSKPGRVAPPGYPDEALARSEHGDCLDRTEARAPVGEE